MIRDLFTSNESSIFDSILDSPIGQNMVEKSTIEELRESANKIFEGKNAPKMSSLNNLRLISRNFF